MKSKIVTFLTTLLMAVPLTAADRPNVLFIVSEDNSEHIGSYGEKRVHTPALDSLAKDGVRYTRAYVPYSVCSPSRAVFLTGLYTRQTGHIGLATHKFSFYKDFQTMPSYFQQAGYYTGDYQANVWSMVFHVNMCQSLGKKPVRSHPKRYPA